MASNHEKSLIFAGRDSEVSTPPVGTTVRQSRFESYYKAQLKKRISAESSLPSAARVAPRKTSVEAGIAPRKSSSAQGSPLARNSCRQRSPFAMQVTRCLLVLSLPWDFKVFDVSADFLLSSREPLLGALWKDFLWRLVYHVHAEGLAVARRKKQSFGSVAPLRALASP